MKTAMTIIRQHHPAAVRMPLGTSSTGAAAGRRATLAASEVEVTPAVSSVTSACEDAGDDVGVFLPSLKSFMGSFRNSVMGLRAPEGVISG